MNARTVSLALLALCAVIVFAAGCAVVVIGGAGAGTYYYFKGELSRTYAATMDHSAEAAELALKDLKLNYVVETKDQLSADLTAIRSNGDKIRIHLESVKPNSIKIGVRVGTFGDKDVSTTLHEEIFSILKSKGYLQATAK
jgi:hypothetical protein